MYGSTFFLASERAAGEWSASRPSRFTPGERAPVSTGQQAGWAPETVWTTWRKISWPYRDPNSDPSGVQPVASRYTDYAIPAPNLSPRESTQELPRK
jgi:hypothetical protein